MKKDIAVVVLNNIQFTSVIAGIKELIEQGYSVDFYCPKKHFNKGFENMFKSTLKLVKSKGYNVYDTAKKINYKVLLEPYPTEFNINSKYKIRYRYSALSAKPNIVFQPYNYIMYDCILCSGKYDENYYRVFTETKQTDNLKFINYKHKDNFNKKPVLLYLPTYGKESSIDDIIDSLILLRKKYYVIVKIHHGTSYLLEETNRVNNIKKNVDEFYDSSKDLSDLFGVTDVVLTDNSGSVFESLYNYIPVAVYCDDLNKNKAMDFDTTQYILYKKGILPYTNKSKDISLIIKQALSKKIHDKQIKWSKENFLHTNKPIDSFVNVIKKYLTDTIDKRYIQMHNILKKDYYDKCNEINKLNNLINVLTEEKNELQNNNNNIMTKYNNLMTTNNNLNTKLKDYENGKLYKIAKKIYSLKNRG